MSRTIIIFFVVIVFAIVGYKIVSTKPANNLSLPSLTSSAPKPTSHPLSIDALRTRTYNSKITKDRPVRETDKFTSWVVSFQSDGLKEYALLNIPKGEKPTKGWPVVVVNHGHIEPDVYSVEKSYINTSAYFANAGFLVIKPDYRGHDNSEGESETISARIGYAIDVLNLIAGLSSVPEADTKNVFIYGHSMGGDVTLRTLEVCGTCAKAATLWAPAVTTFPESVMYFARKNRDPKFTDRANKRQQELDKMFPDKNYQSISSFDHVELVSVPVIIQHATTDESVPYSWGVTLSDQFKKSGKQVTLYTYPGDNHDITKNWGTALKRDVDFFRKNLDIYPTGVYK